MSNLHVHVLGLDQLSDKGQYMLVHGQTTVVAVVNIEFHTDWKQWTYFVTNGLTKKKSELCQWLPIVDTGFTVWSNVL